MVITLATICVFWTGSIAGQYRGAITLHSVDPSRAVRQKLEPILAAARSISITLTLDRKGSYVLHRGKGSIFTAEKSEGRWTKLDKQLVLMPSKVDGKSVSRPAQILAPRRDNWILKLPGAGDLRGEVVFKRTG